MVFIFLKDTGNWLDAVRGREEKEKGDTVASRIALSSKKRNCEY